MFDLSYPRFGIAVATLKRPPSLPYQGREGGR